MIQSTVATAREESVYLPVMARLLKVEQLTELEKLFTLQLPGGRSLGNAPGQFVEVSVRGRSLSVLRPAVAMAPLSCVCGASAI